MKYCGHCKRRTTGNISVNVRIMKGKKLYRKESLILCSRCSKRLETGLIKLNKKEILSFVSSIAVAGAIAGLLSFAVQRQKKEAKK